MSFVISVVTESVLPNATTFIVIGFAAFLLPLLARRIGLPAVVLEILFGLLIGPQVLGLIAAESTSEGFVLVLAELGLFLLMFLAGFEINFTSLEREGRGPIVVGIVAYVVVVALAWVGFGFLDLATLNARVFLTLLVSAASVGIIVPALRATNRSGSRQGQITIVVGILAEFIAATGIIVFAVWVKNGWGIELLAVPLFAVILLVSLWPASRSHCCSCSLDCPSLSAWIRFSGRSWRVPSSRSCFVTRVTSRNGFPALRMDSSSPSSSSPLVFASRSMRLQIRRCSWLLSGSSSWRSERSSFPHRC